MAYEEKGDFPGTAVCIVHWRFMPCRKTGKCTASGNQADISKAARIQIAEFRRNRAIARMAETWPLAQHIAYGEPQLTCNGLIVQDQYIVHCGVAITGFTLQEIRSELHRHIDHAGHVKYPSGEPIKIE